MAGQLRTEAPTFKDPDAARSGPGRHSATNPATRRLTPPRSCGQMRIADSQGLHDARLPPANCKTVLLSTTIYRNKTSEWSTGPRFRPGIRDDELRSWVCQASCVTALSNDVRRLNGVRAGWPFEEDVPATMAGELRPPRPSPNVRQDADSGASTVPTSSRASRWWRRWSRCRSNELCHLRQVGYV